MRPAEGPNDAGDALAVVAIGASAGGLEALRQLLPHVPADSGLAFVVILHLDPERPSMLARILDAVTPFGVVEAADGMALAANRVHVIPPGVDLAIKDGRLALVRRRGAGGLHLPIDTFFRALADDRHGQAIGVVLSGSGVDGTEGLRAIKAAGGIAMAQAPDSAQFRSMPESAIGAGVVDFRAPPAELARELARLSRHPYLVAPRGDEDGGERPQVGDVEGLDAVLALVRQRAGMDFGGYKRTTVQRRIERRMALRRAGGFEEYLATLREDPTEARALARDMLIHVTSFFRDPEAFAALQERVLRPLVAHKRDVRGGSVRVWVPGCSTGEEAYALAICLLEVLPPGAEGTTLKVFGTDLSPEAIDVARVGVYPAAAMGDVSGERLARFFEPAEGGYRIGRRVRDLCVFVKHDVLRDPPFARLDLISCRNVLIYFDTELQRRVLPVLHYCLNEGGALFLGQSEAIGGFRDLFAPIDAEHRLFAKVGDSRPGVLTLSAGREAVLRDTDRTPLERRHPAREAQRQADHLLLARYAPVGVLVNDQLEVVQFRGRTGAYLEPPPGQPQANLLRMAREGLAPHLHEALERARADSASVRREGLQVRRGDEVRAVNLEVIPLQGIPGASGRHLLVLFEEPAARAGRPERAAGAAGPEVAAGDHERLRAELVATRDYMQSLVQDHQTTSDELAATNEELIAANEELQSTNEELQSAKEELQSTNEELSTVNDELRHRNAQLDQLASDLVNVLSSVELPLIIVDLERRVRRFTPTAREVAHILPGDVGRPLEDLKLRVDVPDLGGRVLEVVDTLTPGQWEVQAQDGRWFRMHIRPYRTTDQRLDGAVISFVDVDALRRALREVEAARDYAQSIVETVTEALVVLDAGLRIVSANETFYRDLAQARRPAEGVSLFDLGRGMCDAPALRRALEEILATGAPFTGVELPAALPDGRSRVLSLTGRRLSTTAAGPAEEGQPMVLLAIVDVTDLRRLEAERTKLLESERQSRREAERANRAKDLFLATLSHELRTPLSTMLMWAEYLKRAPTADPTLLNAFAAVERAAKAQAKLIEDLLDVSRIASGKLLLDLGPVDLEAVVRGAVEVARPTALAKSLDLQVAVEGPLGPVYGDAARLQQVAQNLLANAIKFTPRGGRVSVRLERQGDQARLSVSDTGMGIRREVLPRLFGRFVQADSSVTRTHGGLGLGLSIVRHLVEVHGGEVHAESEGEGRGATFTVTLPLGAGPPVAPTPTPVARTIEGTRVLLVEDDDDTRAAYAAMLRELGAQVRAEASAAAGFAALADFRPDVVLSDIAMPGEDGFSFIERVRRLPPERGGRVPAAAVTALAGDEDRRRALEAGFQLHVAKPLDAARLAGVVGALAGRRPGASGAAPVPSP